MVPVNSAFEDAPPLGVSALTILVNKHKTTCGYYLFFVCLFLLRLGSFAEPDGHSEGTINVERYITSDLIIINWICNNGIYMGPFIWYLLERCCLG